MIILNGDCFEHMANIKSGTVDLILVDPPYGTMTTAGAGTDKFKGGKGHLWDITLNTQKMLAECDRVLRPGGAAVLFAQSEYTLDLMNHQTSALPLCYRCVWVKDSFGNPLSANKAPLSYFEDILVFRKNYDTNNIHPLRAYSKQILEFIGKTKKELFEKMGHQGADHFLRHKSTQFELCTAKTYQELVEVFNIDQMQGFKSFDKIKAINEAFNEQNKPVFNLPEGKNHKSNVFEYAKDKPSLHPTQKPIALLEDLIKTYSNEGDLVVDFCMGAGSTGVAAKNTNRQFIGIELDQKYFEIAKKRITTKGK